MQPSRLVKTATLASFVLLLSGFVAYRTGAFDDFLGDANANPRQAAMSKGADLHAALTTGDSTPPKPTIFPGSKSAPVWRDQAKVKVLPDSAKAAYRFDGDSTAQEDPQIMWGYKEGPVFPPPVEKPKKEKRKKQKKD